MACLNWRKSAATYFYGKTDCEAGKLLLKEGGFPGYRSARRGRPIRP